MAKPIVGIDIGADYLKLVLFKGGKIKKAAIVSVPENIFKDGQITSVGKMTEVLKKAMSKNRIHAKEAALVLNSDNVFVRNVTLPQMTHEQLLFNLQYEFKDYITKDPKDYVFDYSMISTVEEMVKSSQKNEEKEAENDAKDAIDADNDFDEGQEASMELTAVVAPRELLDEAYFMLKKVGLKMVKAAPAVTAYSAIIKRRLKNSPNVDANKEFCIMDLGYRTIRIYMFKGENHNVTRVLETGLSTIDKVVAKRYDVDMNTAHTYLLKNYDDCQNSEECINAFGSIAIELMRVLNFYRFSNPDSTLEDIWMCGGGASIPALRSAIEEMIDLKFHPGNDLLKGAKIQSEFNNILLATGIALS